MLNYELGTIEATEFTPKEVKTLINSSCVLTLDRALPFPLLKYNPPLGNDESNRRVIYLIWIYDTSRA